ncbi:MAG: hypothetical protein EOO03_10635, partial [Chitinophagaceae bacterium]
MFVHCIDGRLFKNIAAVTSPLATEEFVQRIIKTPNATYALTSAAIISLQSNLAREISFGKEANNVVDALVDAEQNIWVASWEGLLKYKRTTFTQHFLNNDNQEIFSFVETAGGDLLFGGNHGKVFTKTANGLQLKNGMPLMFPNAEVLCMTETAPKVLWAGSGYDGISKLSNGILQRLQQGQELQDNNCEAMVATTDGKLLACTEQGVTLLNPQLAQPVVEHYLFEKKYARYPELFGGIELTIGNYFFYGSQGLFKLQNKKLVAANIVGMPITQLYITKIVKASDSSVWIGTIGKGLLHCVVANGKLLLKKAYNTQSIAASDIALAVLVDKNRNIWWGDYVNLFCLYSPGKQELLASFSEQDGLLSSYYQSLKLEQQKNGTIWGLTSMGAFSFSPDSIRTNHLPPVLQLQKVTGTEGNQNLLEDFNNHFAHFNNSPQFYFTAVSLTDPSRIRYAHRLIGFDSAWSFSNERTVTYRHLPPGNYRFELRAANNNNVWTPSTIEYAFVIAAPFWNTWWFWLLIALVLLSLVTLLFRRRINVIKQKALIKQQMAGLEAKAIRAQMNPHFIFNSLNAIQESIVLNDYNTAYQYLSKFSKLLRLVLNNSDKNLIPLSSEIEMNRLYLELESLRFKHSFHYQILVDEKLDTDHVEAPSLLVQPFLENAVWHGLMPKAGVKNLLLHFYLQQQQLHCVIEDNGIGREKAAHIKANKLGSHHFESKGSLLAMQRIQLLKDTCGINT